MTTHRAQGPSSTMKRGEHTVTMTWIRTDDLSVYAPVTQCYGICFDAAGNILVAREPEKKWQLTGGTPERGETLKQTLVREFLEEADVKVKNIRPLGVQMVEFPNNPNKNEGNLYYQARFVCEVDEMLPQTPDPATGKTWERKLVSSGQVTEYVKWGELGAAMFADAIEKARKN